MCPYCASPSIVDRPPSRDRPPPVFTLGFLVTKDVATRSVRSWLGSQGIFAESGLKSASIEEIRGVYVPAYLYTAVAKSEYAAEVGENYQETETYTTTDSNGKTVTRTRTVTRTEWRSLEGHRAGYVMDILVTASRGIVNVELERIEPYDLRALRRYTPALLSGWIAEEPTMSADECIALARTEAVEKVAREVDAFMPGDSHRGLQVRSWLENESADLVHVPLWVLAARYDADKPPIRILVNGQTGKVVGYARVAKWKVALFVVAVLGGLALLYFLLLGGR